MSQSLLEEYIQKGDIQGLQLLLKDNPALAVSGTSQRVSPLMLSCYNRNPEVMEVLLDFVGELTLFEAAAIGKLESVAHHLFEDPNSINNFSEDGFIALGLAAYFGQEEVARYLLLKGADPNLPSQNGFHVYPLHSAVAANQEMIVKMLLEGGAEVNVAQMKGITPLHSAAHNGNIEMLIILLEAGADVKATSEDGRTPSEMAAEKGFHEIAKILMD